MLPFLRALRAVMILASLAAFFSLLSKESLQPGFEQGHFFGLFHVLGAMAGMLGLLGTAFSPTGGGGRGSLRGGATLYAVLAAALSWAQAPLGAPAWAALMLAAVLPAFLTADWFWSPPPEKPGFGTAALWCLGPALYLAWALTLPAAGWHPYALLDPVKAGGELLLPQNAALLFGAALLITLAFLGLTRLRQKNGEPEAPRYNPQKGLESRDKASRDPLR